MFELMELRKVISPIPMLDIRVKDLQIDMKPSDYFLLPSVHIDAKIDFRFLW